MGSEAADTQREIGALRSDMDAALAELKRRFAGGTSSVTATEARIAGTRASEDVKRQVQVKVGQVRQDPAAMSLLGTAVAAAVGYAVYEVVERWQERRRPENRLKRRARNVRHELEEQLEQRLKEPRQVARRVRERGVKLTFGGPDADQFRLTDREGKPLDEEPSERTRKDMLKNLLWGLTLALFMAAGSVVARRVAGAVWKATLREDPPTE